MTVRKAVPEAAVGKTGGKGMKPDYTMREKFAQQVFEGKNATDALRAIDPERCARIKKGSVYRMAASYSCDEWVVARVKELRAKATEVAVEKAGIDRAYVLAKLRSIVERCMQSEAVVDRRGQRVKVETPEGEELSAAYTFNPAGANKALELLGKEIGMFVDRKEVRTGALDGLTDDELTRLAKEFAAQSGLALTVTGAGEAESGEPSSAVPALREAEGVSRTQH